MALEPRMMYDAAAAATVGAAAHHHHHQDGAGDHASVAAAEPLGSHSHRSNSGQWDTSSSWSTSQTHASQNVQTPPPPPADVKTTSSSLNAIGGTAPAGGCSAQQSVHEIVFIDSRVTDYQILVNGVKPGVTAVVLDPSQDGLTQIADYLSAHPDSHLAAIDIVAHGAQGELLLGSTTLTDANLPADAGALQRIGDALAPGGSIALYGCNVAVGAAGLRFISDLSKDAGAAAVAAATHDIGSAAHGGSWDLDTATGRVDVRDPFTAAARNAFPDLLTAAPTVTLGTTPTSFTGGSAGVPVDPGLTVTDPSGTLVGASVQIIGFVNGDTLTINGTTSGAIHNGANATINYAFSGSTLTLSGTDTVADYQAALRQVSYSFAGNGDPTVGGANTSRSIYWVVSNGTLTNEVPPLGLPISNDQPSLGLNQLVVEQGLFPAGGGATTQDSGGIPLGSIRTFAGNLAPAGTAFADGQLLSIAQNSPLFSVLGPTYGGNGTTNFELPNLQGRLATGSENSASTVLGESYGTDNITLTAQNLPARWGGSGVAFNNDQPSQAINYIINTGGSFPSGGVNTDVIGEVVPFLGDNAPNGYMLANGQLLNINQNQALFSILGTTYGGDGITTFALPNLTDRTIVGAGNDSFHSVAAGTTTGQDSTTLTTSNLPFPAGGAQPVSDDQPSLSLTYLVATVGLFPGPSTTPDPKVPYIGEVIAFAGTGGALDNMINSGWAVANGQIESISSNATLFAVVGTTYGGNGTTTFALPDLVGRSVAGVGTNSGGLSVAPGQSYGSDSFTLTASTTPLPNVATSTLDIVHEPPSVTAGATATFTGGGAAVTLDPTLSVNDVDSGGLLTGATIAIGSGFTTGDTLDFNGGVAAHFADGGTISGTYSSATGVLTVSGQASVTDYQTVLSAVTYSFSPSNGDPTARGLDTQRLITWQVSDGSVTHGTSTLATSLLATVHAAPSVTAGGMATFAGGSGTAVALDGTLTVGDIDSGGFLTGATVTISAGSGVSTGGFIAGDTLSFTSQSGITGIYDPANGALTLRGKATVSEYQTVLDSVTYSYSPSNGDPTGEGADKTSRTITWRVDDGSARNGTSTVAFSTLDVVHTAPSVTAGGTTMFTGGSATPVLLDPTLSLSDPDSFGNLTSATVSISSGFLTGDRLNFTGGNISGFYDSATGVLTLRGTASVAQYQAALDSITYSFTPTNGDPTGGAANHTSRTISWVVTDGAVTNNISNTGTSTLDMAHLAPTVTPSGTVATFTGGSGTAVTLDGSLSVNDVDTSTLTSATVSISSGFLNGDTLTINGTTSGTINDGANGSISYSFSGSTLTLSGTDTVTDYAAALDLVKYSFNPANGDPTGATANDTARTINWVVNDGTSTNTPAATSTLNVVHVPPTVTAGATATFTGGGPAVTLDGGLTVSDVDSGGNLTGATVTISSGFLSGDTLNFTNQNGITSSYDAVHGVLTLSAASPVSVTNFRTALDSITYSFNPANGDPTGATANDTARTISWQVIDGAVTNGSSNPATSTLDVVHVASTVTAGATATFTGGGSAVTLDGALTVSEVDSDGNLTGATVSISSGFLSGDTLTINGTTSGTINNGANGIIDYALSGSKLTLSGTDTVTDYAAALDLVKYSFAPTNGDPTGAGANDTTRQISWQVIDGAVTNGSSNTATSTLDVVHVAPAVTAGASVTYTQGQSLLPADSTATVTDPDSNNLLTSVTVAITTGFQRGDVLNADTTGVAVRASYDAIHGILTLSGSDTPIDYQHVMDSVTFNSTSANPSNFGTDRSRTLTWTASDAASSSTPQTSTIQLVPVNDTPVVTAGATVNFTQGGTAVIVDSGLDVTDNDQQNLSSATVSITSGFFAGDTLAFNNGAAKTYGDGGSIASSYNSATGVLTLSGTNASVADFKSALETVTFSNSGSNPSNFGTDFVRSISWTVNDGASNPPFRGAPGNDQSVTVTSTVDITGVNDTPVVNGVAGTHVTFTQDAGAVPLDLSATIADNDQTSMAGATVQITGGLLTGDVLNFTDQNGIHGSYDGATGKLTLTGISSIANYDAALQSITFVNTNVNPSSFGTDLSRTISWSVNDGATNPPFSNAPGSDQSAVVTSTVDIQATPHVLAGAGVSFTAAIGNTVVLDPTVAVHDGTNLTGATISIGNGFVSGDTIGVNTAGTSIHASYDAVHGILTLSGNDTIQDYQKVLASATFGSIQQQDGDVTIAWQVTDQHKLASAIATSQVRVTGAIVPPHLFTDNHASFLPQSVTPAPLVVDAGPRGPLVPPPDGGSSGSSFYVVHTDAVLTTASDATVRIKLALAALEAPLGGDVAFVTARQANGDPLPDWLKFDPATGTFAGLPPDNAVASIEPDRSADNNIITGSIPPKPDLGMAGANTPATPNTITVEVLARDSKGNIAVTVFTIDLRAHTAGKQGWNMDWTRPFGHERHASLPMPSPELAAIEAAVRDVTRPLEPFGLRGIPIGHGEQVAVGSAEAAPAGRAGLTEQLASIGWRSIDAQRNALLASLQGR